MAIDRGDNSAGAGSAAANMANLLSTASGLGASLVGIHDADGRFSGANVESALTEVVTRVATITALRALTPSSSNLTVEVIEAGRAGLFVWTSGDQSANVTADTQSGIWVAPASASTGASGAWKRSYSGAVNVKWFGAKGDWNGTTGTDDTTALQAAIAAVPSGGVVYFPAGTYKLTSPLDVVSNVTYVGDGMGVSVIACVSASAMWAFYDATATTGAPLENITWMDMTWDGSGVTHTSSKGIYASYLRNCKWVRVSCVDFPATGFGADYLVDCVFDHCIAEGNGRLLSIDDAGASGFGIGTGEYAVENTTLTGCVARNNKNYGIFFEQQNVANGGTPYMSKGMRVIGCYTEGNGYGIGDCGVSGLIVQGSIMRTSVRDGFSVNQGTAGGIGVPGNYGHVIGCIMEGNGRYGAFLDYRFKATSDAGYYTITGGHVRGNTASGVQISAPTLTDISNIVLDGVVISGNGSLGVGASGLGGAVNYLTLRNLSCFNNGTTDVSGYTQGIRVDCPTTRLLIQGVAAYDSQASKTQTYGLKISAGVTHTDTLIRDCDFRGNVNADGLDLTGTPTFAGLKVIRNNRGHNPKGSITAPTVPASTVAYTNVTGYDCSVEITGGTVTDVLIGTAGGVSTGRTSGMFRIPAGQSIYLTYTVAPTWTWFAD